MAKTSVFKLPIPLEQIRLFVPYFDKRLTNLDILGVHFQDILPYRITGLLEDGRLFRLEIVSRARASLFIDEELQTRGKITWKSKRINSAWKFKLFFTTTQNIRFTFKLLVNIITGEIYLFDTEDTFLEITNKDECDSIQFRHIDFSFIIIERFPIRLPSLFH